MRKLGFLMVIVILCGCMKTGVKPITGNTAAPVNVPAILPGDTVTYLALGDSYTYGAGVSLAESYPYQLADSLAAKGYRTALPRVVAFQGWTASDLLTGIKSAGINQGFDIVTLLIGVNDQAEGTDMTTYTKQFDELLLQAITYARGYAGRVFVISIPDWSVTPFAAGMDKALIKSGVTSFNMISETECKKFGTTFIDITALSETAATDPSLTSADGLHPSGKMYSLWVKQLAPVIVAKLR